MNIIVYDLVFLVLFAIFVGALLYRGKKNLKKEGILLLYKAKWGMRLIDYVGLKYKRTIHVLSYVSIAMGYVLMAAMIYLMGRIMWIYFFMPNIVAAVKIPPIMPLIPYLPQIFKLDFLPPFYFIYWIVILAVIAVPHEFFHGIFARKSGVKIKSTGFGFFPFFLPVFLAAFVEQDEHDMKRVSKFDQLAILSAGTFANILTAILVFFVLAIAFTLSFAPVGVEFNTYAYSIVPIENVSSINGVDLTEHNMQELISLSTEEGYNSITFNEYEFIASKGMLTLQENSSKYISLFHDAPAIHAELDGAISKINDEAVLDLKSLSSTLSKYSPGETIIVETISDDEIVSTHEIVLGENPVTGESWLGVGFNNNAGTGVRGKIYSILSSFKKHSNRKDWSKIYYRKGVSVPVLS